MKTQEFVDRVTGHTNVQVIYGWPNLVVVSTRETGRFTTTENNVG